MTKWQWITSPIWLPIALGIYVVILVWDMIFPREFPNRPYSKE